ncbi:MAG TPA: UDP-3-O-(3-hydroxymyristoyl)glucosamine N-acyltransferase [Steroidobacteraceae bacterium]|jgi:UDP-3-O-[3-hydroxymyristoyl] glucosamine N-acyltransferase|nr:UDP-3-O-(3-hydroxymyristoyl)glucosamine N-acyltransferase [Steroidobacteraceae bacterium]
MAMTLGEIAVRFGLELAGDPGQAVSGVASLAAAAPGTISFCTGGKYRRQLAQTRATAVVLTRELAADCPVAALVSARPYAAWARIANALHPAEPVRAGRAAGAHVDAGARVAASAWIGPNAVIGAGAVVGERCSVGPNCVIEAGASIGDDCRLLAGVTLCHGISAGSRCTFKPGAVVGSDGFGHAQDVDGYVKVPQLGSVRLGNDVEVGANTTIDRGTIEDTVIGDGVKLDNQVQVGHNCRIGAHTVIAGCVGISGSSIIGSRCMIGGAVGIAGHLEIGDDVVVTGYSLVTHSLPGPGMYSSGMPAIEAGKWRRAVARLHRLDAGKGRRGKGQGDE